MIVDVGPELGIGEPWRHFAADYRSLHRFRPGADTLVIQKRHRRGSAGPVTLLTLSLQDGQDVVRERGILVRGKYWHAEKTDCVKCVKYPHHVIRPFMLVQFHLSSVIHFLAFVFRSTQGTRVDLPFGIPAQAT